MELQPFRSPPCLTIRGMTRQEMASLRLLAARYGLSRESLIRDVLRQLLVSDSHRGDDSHRGANARPLAESAAQVAEPGGIPSSFDREAFNKCQRVDSSGDAVLPAGVSTVVIIMSADPAAVADFGQPGFEVCAHRGGGMVGVDPDGVERSVWDLGDGVGRPLP